jgi:nucleotide-binding universal stress UspA family protein
MTAAASNERDIVVGVDGSPASLAALEWAARQAELTHNPLLAITAWEYPRSYGFPIPLSDDFNPAEEAAKVLEDALESVRRDHPSVAIKTLVVEGASARVLIDASKDAELLVVGSRGHGELAGMLLGSVSEQCATHAHCPVVVVRH